MKTEECGDNYLSSHDRKLWNLVQHVLLKWHTLVIYKWKMWNATIGQRGILQFFVPKDCTHRYEIVDFLKYELEKEETEDVKFKDQLIPGVDVEVNVHTFSGLSGYVERDVMEEMSREFLAHMKTELMKMNKKDEENHE